MKTRKITAALSLANCLGEESTTNPAELVGTLWQETAQTVFESCGVYISNCVVTNSSNVYFTSWGCQKSGDKSVILEMTAPIDFSNVDKWQEIAISILTQIKEDLKIDHTINLEISEIDIVSI